MSTLNLRHLANTSWLNAAGVAGFRVRSPSGAWVDKTGNLSGVSARNLANSAWLTFATAASPPPPPPPPPPAAPDYATLDMSLNSLDFIYAPTVNGSNPEGYVQFDLTVSGAPSFFANNGNHVVMALECEGAAGNGHPHPGPIIRRGQNLFEYARGFIFFGDGTVMAEHWNGTTSPGLLTISNSSGSSFNPSAENTLDIRIRAGYRTGAWAETMLIEIWRSTRYGGSLLFSGVAPGWGWARTGNYRACAGAIASGFEAPNPTEVIVPRLAPNARLDVSNIRLSVI